MKIHYNPLSLILLALPFRRPVRMVSNSINKVAESSFNQDMLAQRVNKKVMIGMEKKTIKPHSSYSSTDTLKTEGRSEKKRQRRVKIETVSSLNQSISSKQKVEIEEDKNVKAEIPGDAKQLIKPLSSARPGTKNSTDSLIAKKLSSHARYQNLSPFPDFIRPTPEECKLVHRILTSLHGAKSRPKEVRAPKSRAGCGDSPSVLDALVRTILSQNTNGRNSTRAKLHMDEVYGRSDNWEAIVAGGQSKLQETIKCGGLSANKSRAILGILAKVNEKYGTYSLNHLHTKSNDEAMQELLSFPGVGPKTASCVLLFCLNRESFAVDTHVWRISGILGWRPAKADREETFRHLDVRIPDEDKYGLHVLLINHGKKCPECRAGGKSAGKCELRKAFSPRKFGDEDEKEKIQDSLTIKPNIKIEQNNDQMSIRIKEEQEIHDHDVDVRIKDRDYGMISKKIKRERDDENLSKPDIGLKRPRVKRLRI